MHNDHDYGYGFITPTLLIQLFVRVGILFTHGKHSQDCIMSPRGETRIYKTSLFPLLFIEVPVASQESVRSGICVCGIDLSSISTIFRYHSIRNTYASRAHGFTSGFFGGVCVTHPFIFLFRVLFFLFLLFVFVLCLVYQMLEVFHLWIVHSSLSCSFSLAFIYTNVNIN